MFLISPPKKKGESVREGGGTGRTDAAVIACWQAPRLVALPETILIRPGDFHGKIKVTIPL